MSTKFYVGQKDYIAKLNEIDDLFNEAINASGATADNLAAAFEARDLAVAAVASTLASKNDAAAFAAAAAASAVVSASAADGIGDSAAEAAASATQAAASEAVAIAQASTATTGSNTATASASAASASATAAAGSAASAASQATLSATSASNSAASATAAAASESAISDSVSTAAASASAALTSATNAATSATTAATQATNASTSASNAAASATTASTQAGTATTKASEAVTSATNAAGSATTATTQATNAAASATQSANSATASAGSATTATTQASNAAASATTASTQATNAAASATTASTAVTNAQAQVVLAQAAATSAAVSAASGSATSTPASLDLTAIAAALHRSPNAITAQFIYDTSKDSDGGAWVDRMQDKSWFNEALNGAWLGQQPTEIQARLIGSSVGSEMFSDPDLNNASVWDSNTTRYVVTGGKAVRDNNANAASLRFATTLVVGTTYRVTVQLSSTLPINVPGATGSGSFEVNCYVQGQATNATTPLQSGLLGETLTFFITPTAACNRIGINSGISNYMDIEAVSLKPVTIAANNNNGYYQSTFDGKFYKLHKNQLAYSEQFDNAAWNKFQTTVTTNVAVAPDGTTTADLVVPVVTNSQAVLRPANSVYAGQISTFSVYLKAAGYSRVHLLLADTGNGAAANAFFDLTGNGVLLGTATAGASNITQAISLSNGWYRCSITAQSNGNFTGGGFTAVPSSVAVVGSFPTFTSDGTSGVYAWGAQLESGSVVTSYESKTVGQGTNETFRGNKAKFPRLSAIICENLSVTIYDLTEPGRPMWMRFISLDNTVYMAPTNLSSVFALNGVLCLGGNYASNTHLNGGLRQISFAADKAERLTSGRYRLPISGRNVVSGWETSPLNALTIAGVAMLVLPDAPIDVVTGLQVPTIAIGTSSSIAVIKQDGTVSTASLANAGALILTPTLVGTYRGGTSIFYFIVSPINALPTTFTLSFPTSGIDFFAGGNGKVIGGGKSEILKLGSAAGDPVQKLKSNETTYVRGITARIAPSYGTGHLVGDIRRAYLCNTEVESVTSPELTTNGTFDSDVSGWPVISGGTVAWVGGTLELTGNGGSFPQIAKPIPTVIGKTYRLSVDFTRGTYAGSVYSGTGFDTIVVAASGTITKVFTASSTNTSVNFGLFGGSAVGTVYFDNVSLKEVVPDRSNKASGANIYGTLIKSPVA